MKGRRAGGRGEFCKRKALKMLNKSYEKDYNLVGKGWEALPQQGK